MNEHIIEALGLSKITIKNGKVINVTEPEVEYCPLFHHHRGIEKLTKDEITKNIQYRIDDFGMCTPNRQIRMKDFLSFGISEIISTSLEKNELDSVVMVLEGCGTLIVTEPDLVQGIGGRVSGLIKGIELAIKQGYENIAVTITKASDAKTIAKLKQENPNINIYVFGVHTSKRTQQEARILFDNCDVITACSSKYVREIGEHENIKKVGQSIPIYARTENGKKFLELRLEKIGGEKPLKENPDLPYPLI